MPDSPPSSVPTVTRLRSGTAARLAGVPVATLRVWERRYGVVAAPKTTTGQRLYTGHDVQRLRLIRQLTDRGHAIGTIATLALPALEALAADESVLAAAEAADMPVAARRVVVVGRAAAQRLHAAGVQPLAVYEDLGQAESRAAAQPAASAVDALLVQLSSLQPLSANRVLALAERLGAGTLIVLYAFGAEAVAESLRAAGATVRREPAGSRERVTLLGATPPPRAAVPAPPTVEPRRFSDEELAAVTELNSAVACECPRHVAEIVLQLAGFERYSADCGLHGPADAALHRHLGSVAGAARTMFEQALQRLVAERALVLPPPTLPSTR